MSYLVLARKYRPRTFAEVVGQTPVVRALANALDNERLHHAYLFTGTRGVGKTTLARILAACLNCETGVTSTPCGECAACKEIAAGRFMDLIEVDAASRTGVDDTRELLNNAQFLPSRGRYKVYLIDEVHMLTGHSFNALLKTLEEPPEHVKFLLATTEAKKIPVTVLSRCLQFHLKNMLPEVIEAQLANVLEAEGIAAETPALAAIAHAAAGSMRDALSITDQAISHGGGSVKQASVQDMLGIAGRDEIGALLAALAARDTAGLLAAGDDLAGRSLDLGAVLGELQRAFHDLAIAAELGSAGNVEDGPLARFQNAFSAEDLQLYYQIALLGGRDLAFAPDAKVGFDMTLIRLASFEPAGADARRTNEASAPSATRTRPAPAQARKTAATGTRPDVAEPAPVAKPAIARPAVGKPGPVAEPAPVEKPAVEKPAVVESAPATKPAVSKPAVAEPAPPEDGDQNDRTWHEIVAEMKPAGVTAMILDHTNLVARAGGHWTILLDEGHESLLNDKRRREIADLACGVEGRQIRVDFEIGAPAKETPAAHKARQRSQQRKHAEAALMRDANARRLLDEFDGRLESARLRPSAPARQTTGATDDDTSPNASLAGG